MQEPAAAEGAAEAAPLLRQYLAVRAAPAGADEAALKAQARRVLRARRGGSGLGVRSVAERCLRDRGRSGLLELLRALELLERLCLNLLLCPWRREIRSLKTFTGTFVYYIQPALPDDVVKAVLKKMGYVATTATEFSLVRRSDEETKQTALEIFLARIECEIILETTTEENRGDLEEPRQRSAQTHRHRGGKDRADQTPQRGGTENEEESETSLCLAAHQMSSATSSTSFEAAGSAKIKDDVAQPAALVSSARCGEHHRQVSDTRHFPGKCSDSEDFLIQYSDIVIRQTPVFSEELSPEAAEKQPGDAPSDECALAVTAASPANEIRPVPLSPGASGPPAFAIFADSSRDSKTTPEYGAQGVLGESIEAEINDAMNCTDLDPADEPRELKSLLYRDITSARDSSAPREEEVSELSLTFMKLHIQDTQEDLTYPVEEARRPESEPYASPSDRPPRDPSHSRMKPTYVTRAEMQNRAAARTEPPSELCCAGNAEDPTTGSNSKRLLVGTPGAEGFRHLREPPTLTYIPPQSISVQSSQARGSSTQGRRNLSQPKRDSAEASEMKLENCNWDTSDTQEPYVVIDRTDPGMLCYHT